VTAEEDVARARCLERNTAPVGSFALPAQAYDDLRYKYHPLEPDEPHHTIDTNGQSCRRGYA
jgi:hypothetical protein